MTTSPNGSYGTMSEQSTPSGDGSTRQSPMLDLKRLIKGDLKSDDRQTEVTEGSDNLSELSGDTQSGGEDDIRALAEKLLDAKEHRDRETAASDEEEGEGEASEGGREAPKRLDGERTLKQLADELDINYNDLYEMQIPLNDGTGRHVSVEALRAGYLGTDADALSRGQAEHSERLAAFEVDKTEHEQAVIRDRQELGAMMSMLAKHLPPNEIKAARVEAQRRLAASAADILERFPGWRDHKVAAAWQAAANKVLGKYGFSAAEASAISDGRLLSLLDSHFKLLDWAEKVKNPRSAPAKPPKSAQHKPRGGRSVNKHDAAIERALRSGATRQDKLEGVMAVLAKAGQ